MAILDYKCPNCGAPVKFDSALQQMRCENCDTELTLDSLREYDDILSAERPSDFSWATYNEDSGSGAWSEAESAAVASATCPSCGAVILSEDTTAATECPYCGNVVVISERITGMLKPDFVIPFKISKEEATQKLKAFCAGKKLLPRGFLAENRIEKMTGLYVPYWLYSCKAQAAVTYNATRVRTWSDSQYNYTQTSHYLLEREGGEGFSNIPVNGTTKLTDDYFEAIEPFDYTALQAFNTAYLSGYLADRYDVSAADGQPRANERVESTLATELRGTVGGYATVTERSRSVKLESGDISYALMPVWILNTRYKGETYTYVINGQSGKLVGKLPIDKAKAWSWFAGIALGLTAVGSLISLLVLGG